MNQSTAIYVRQHPAHAWSFERFTNAEAAALEREVNKNFGVQTLLLPPRVTQALPSLPRLLDSYHVQSDFLA